jgi:hypothetical protein
MRVRFTHVRLASPGTHHSHITNLKATGDDAKPYDGTRAEWVKFIEDGGSGCVHTLLETKLACTSTTTTRPNGFKPLLA